MTELFELVRYRYYIELGSEANVLKMLEWLIVVMKAEDDGSEQLVSLARTSLVFILQSNLPVMAVLGLARRKNSVASSFCSDGSWYPFIAKSFAACQLAKPLFFPFGSILTYDMVNTQILVY